MKITDLDIGLLQDALKEKAEAEKGIDFALSIIDTNEDKYFVEAMSGALGRMASFLNSYGYKVERVLMNIEEREEQQKHIDEVLGEETDEDDYNKLIKDEVEWLDGFIDEFKTMIDFKDRNKSLQALESRVNVLNRILDARWKK